MPHRMLSDDTVALKEAYIVIRFDHDDALANVIGDTSSTPSWLTMSDVANTSYAWPPPGSDVRALQKASNPSVRIAECWYGNLPLTNLSPSCRSLENREATAVPLAAAR